MQPKRPQIFSSRKRGAKPKKKVAKLVASFKKGVIFAELLKKPKGR